MITAKTFLRAQGLIQPDANDLEIVIHHGTGKSFSLCDLLDEYHKLKMEEAGFKKDDKNREDTIKL